MLNIQILFNTANICALHYIIGSLDITGAFILHIFPLPKGGNFFKLKMTCGEVFQVGKKKREKGRKRRKEEKSAKKGRKIIKRGYFFKFSSPLLIFFARFARIWVGKFFKSVNPGWGIFSSFVKNIRPCDIMACKEILFHGKWNFPSQKVFKLLDIMWCVYRYVFFSVAILFLQTYFWFWNLFFFSALNWPIIYKFSKPDHSFVLFE